MKRWRDLVQVAHAKDAVEAELIKGLLDDGDIPSLLRPIGVRGPEFGIGLQPPTPIR